MNSQTDFIKWVLMARPHKETKKAYFSSKGSMVCQWNSFFADLHNTGINCFVNYCACLFSIPVSIIKIKLVLKHFNIIDTFIKIRLYNIPL